MVFRQPTSVPTLTALMPPDGPGTPAGPWDTDFAGGASGCGQSGSLSDATTMSSPMENPLWLLVPWAVFAIAVGLKLWRLGALIRRSVLNIPSRSERFRQSLERLWEKEQQAR